MFTDEAVLLTCAQLNSKGIRSHVAEQDDHVRIELQLPSLTEEEKKAIVSEFMSDLVLNQVRVATNEQFKGIRDTLYQAAFLPVMKR